MRCTTRRADADGDLDMSLESVGRFNVPPFGGGGGLRCSGGEQGPKPQQSSPIRIPGMTFGRQVKGDTAIPDMTLSLG